MKRNLSQQAPGSRRRKGVAMAAVATLVGLASPLLVMPVADASTLTVTSTVDGGAGSLRRAIADANAAGGAHTIVLGSNLSYALDDCNAGALTSTAGPLTIQGNGSTIRQTCPDA